MVVKIPPLVSSVIVSDDKPSAATSSVSAVERRQSSRKRRERNEQSAPTLQSSDPRASSNLVGSFDRGVQDRCCSDASNLSFSLRSLIPCFYDRSMLRLSRHLATEQHSPVDTEYLLPLPDSERFFLFAAFFCSVSCFLFLLWFPLHVSPRLLFSSKKMCSAGVLYKGRRTWIFSLAVFARSGSGR